MAFIFNFFTEAVSTTFCHVTNVAKKIIPFNDLEEEPKQCVSNIMIGVYVAIGFIVLILLVCCIACLVPPLLQLKQSKNLTNALSSVGKAYAVPTPGNLLGAAGALAPIAQNFLGKPQNIDMSQGQQQVLFA
jgi:hypothetical protein